MKKNGLKIENENEKYELETHESRQKCGPKPNVRYLVGRTMAWLCPR